MCLHGWRHILTFYADAGIDGSDAVFVGQQGVDVDLLDLCA